MKLVHDTVKVILVTNGAAVHTHHTVFEGTIEEIRAEAARLNLQDPRNLLTE